MNLKKVVAAVLLVGALCASLAGYVEMRQARADVKALHPSMDSWSGHVEVQVPFSQAITLGGGNGVVCSATASVAWNVRALTITNSASGVVRLYSGHYLDGTKLIGSFAVIANTPLKLNEDDLGQGIKTAVGSELSVDAATGTLSMQLRVRKDPN